VTQRDTNGTTNTSNDNSNNNNNNESSDVNNSSLNPILFQVVPASFNDAVQLDTIRIDQSAANTLFSIKIYALKFYKVTIVNKNSVVLDVVELVFKDHNVNGDDRLRIKKYMENSCVHLKKIIEFCSMRFTVFGMFNINSEMVSCGYISDKTRIAFRSQSAMVIVYIQMSREMWEFDVNGEMYHEKALDFLAELFTNWKQQACLHDVTIALFSRVYYEDDLGLKSFKPSFTSKIEKDHKGHLYEDFYRVVYTNERYEDWTPTLFFLRSLIKDYREHILEFHENQLQLNDNQQEQQQPKWQLSSAAQGNYLETINILSTVFERSFIDTQFDATGSMSVIITAGNGVFEVSKDLAKLTKERVIDNAIGSDLVCLGEQPLHAVPLFKYSNDSIENETTSYSVPYGWINLSYYKTTKALVYQEDKFFPSAKIRIGEQSTIKSIVLRRDQDSSQSFESLEETDNMFDNSLSNSKYSKRSFINSSNNNMKQLRNRTSIGHLQQKQMQQQTSRTRTKRGTSINSLNEKWDQIVDDISQQQKIDDQNENPNLDVSFKVESESDSDQSDFATVSFHSNSIEINNGNDPNNCSTNIYKKTKKRVNPFKPSSFKPKMSFERRRWAHVFPLSTDGTPIYEHRTTTKSSFSDNLELLETNSNNNNNNKSEAKNLNTASSSYNSNQFYIGDKPDWDTLNEESMATMIYGKLKFLMIYQQQQKV
jgi:DEP domain-containing protein 5